VSQRRGRTKYGDSAQPSCRCCKKLEAAKLVGLFYCTDLHEVLAAIIRAALADEALATGLKGRIAEMEGRLSRLQDRAAKRRQIAKDVMVELDLKKIAVPDFTVSVRPGMPGLTVIDEADVPSIYWEPRDPRLNRHGLLADLKQGVEITGVTLSNPEPVLSVRTK
jgi:hypothetical protein